MLISVSRRSSSAFLSSAPLPSSSLSLLHVAPASFVPSVLHLTMTCSLRRRPIHIALDKNAVGSKDDTFVTACDSTLDRSPSPSEATFHGFLRHSTPTPPVHLPTLSLHPKITFLLSSFLHRFCAGFCHHYGAGQFVYHYPDGLQRLCYRDMVYILLFLQPSFVSF